MQSKHYLIKIYAKYFSRTSNFKNMGSHFRKKSTSRTRIPNIYLLNYRCPQAVPRYGVFRKNMVQSDRDHLKMVYMYMMCYTAHGVIHITIWVSALDPKMCQTFNQFCKIVPYLFFSSMVPSHNEFFHQVCLQISLRLGSEYIHTNTKSPNSLMNESIERSISILIPNSDEGILFS